MARRLTASVFMLLLLAACADSGGQGPTSSASAPAASFTLPADLPLLKCADFEPPPVAKTAEKIAGRRCSDGGGGTRWINGFYQCTDGRVWPVLGSTPARPQEPVGAAFDACVGRVPPPG